MDPILPALEAEAAHLHHADATCTFFSSVTAREESSLEPSYWRRNTRAPVRFQASLERLFAIGRRRPRYGLRASGIFFVPDSRARCMHEANGDEGCIVGNGWQLLF